MGKLMSWIAAGGMVAAMTVSALADVALPGLFRDNMVLQRDVKIPVWGTAAAGESVTVTLGEKKATATAGADGTWKVTLDAQKAGPVKFTVAGKNTITLNNVAMGDVWVCGGQSNMEFRVKSANDAEKEIAAAKYPDIRLCFSRWKLSREPLKDVEQRWEPCSPANVGEFSAVGYFFGRDVQSKVKVPVGLVWCAASWTPSEAWTSREGLASDPEIKRDVLGRWEKLQAAYPAKKAAYDKKLAEWKKAEAEAKAAGKPFTTPAPGEPAGGDFIHTACLLYNGSIAPLTQLPVRGVIWYQGETNADRAIQYRKLMPILINDWRKAWGQPDMPFLYVQIANLGPLQTQPGEGDRAELRESQALSLKVPNTAMAVTIDIGDEKDEHPKNKQDVGARLALGARAIAYGEKDLVYSGPIYESSKVEGDKIRLKFKHVGGGLVAKGGELKGFAIAGEDRKFVWADAKIDGETIVVSSPKVAKPVAVRYGWDNNPIISLYNKESLPASPFRTDDWPGVTTGKVLLWVETVMKE